MQLMKKISALWPKKAAPAAPTAPAPQSYGVVIRSDTASDSFTDPAFVAVATPLAEKLVAILKQNGKDDVAQTVTIGALSTIQNHQGVRFTADAATAQLVADALPGQTVIRSDCRVVCTAASADLKTPPKMG